MLQQHNCSSGLRAFLPPAGTCMCSYERAQPAPAQLRIGSPVCQLTSLQNMVQADPLSDLLDLMPCPCLRSASWLPLQVELAALREAAEQAQATAARQHERLLDAEMSITSLQVGCLAACPGARQSAVCLPSWPASALHLCAVCVYHVMTWAMHLEAS